MVEGLLKKDLEKTGAYDSACSLELGITLTSVDAKTITQSGLEVPTQRLAVLLRAKGTQAGGLVIEQAAPTSGERRSRPHMSRLAGGARDAAPR